MAAAAYFFKDERLFAPAVFSRLWRNLIGLSRKKSGFVTNWLSASALSAAYAKTAGCGCMAAIIFSAVNGAWRKRTPVASNKAFAIAAGPGTEADSPAPIGG